MTGAPPEENPPLPFPTVRANVPLTAPMEWLRAGWQDFRACCGASLFYGACFLFMGWILVLTFWRAVHLASAVTAGFLLVGPFVAIGLYALSRQREAGEPIRLRPTLMAWHTKRGAIAVYSLILIIVYLIWARASMVTFALFYQGSMPSVEGFVAALLRLDDLEFFAVYLVVGGFFAAFVYALSVVSVPLMLDRDQDAVTAMIASVITLGRNLPTVLVWAALIVLLVLVAFATGFLGMLVIGPVLGHATWHAFRALIEPLPAAATPP